jgi:hypothetical protein
MLQRDFVLDVQRVLDLDCRGQASTATDLDRRLGLEAENGHIEKSKLVLDCLSGPFLSLDFFVRVFLGFFFLGLLGFFFLVFLEKEIAEHGANFINLAPVKTRTVGGATLGSARGHDRGEDNRWFVVDLTTLFVLRNHGVCLDVSNFIIENSAVGVDHDGRGDWDGVLGVDLHRGLIVCLFVDIECASLREL